jgi:sugar lactone lactonase YvrE
MITGGLRMFRAWSFAFLLAVFGTPTVASSQVTFDRAWSVDAPMGIAVDASDRIYVCAFNSIRVEVYASSGQLLRTIATSGRPIGVGVADNGDTYVSTETNRVYRYNSAGTLLGSFGGTGTGPAQFQSIRGLDVDSQGKVYVSDAYLNLIKIFSSTGTLLTQWGFRVAGDPVMNNPSDVAVDAAGNGFVADGLNHRILAITPDNHYLRYWGTEGYGPGQLVVPLGVAFDSQGLLYVSEQGSRITVFTAAGDYVTLWGQFGIAPDGCCFNVPSDVVVDSFGAIYVSDQGNKLVKKFLPAATDAAPRTWGSIKSLYRM